MTSFLFLGRSGIGAAKPRQFPNVFVEKPVVSSHRRWREIYLRLQTLKLYNFLIFELPKKKQKNAQQFTAQNGKTMVRRSHKNGRKTWNSRVETSRIFHLLYFCDGRSFLSDLSRTRFYALD